MGNFTFGLQIMWRIWRDPQLAERVRKTVAGPAPPEPERLPERVRKAAPERQRSEALTLLSVLQREGRLVDFLKEPISGYTDAQIGAAVRDIHRGCSAALDRLFQLQPFLQANEGSTVEVPRGFDPIQYRLTGQVSGEPPFRGTVRHSGWKATRCDLPQWTGGDPSSGVVAPAEVEVR